MTDSIASGSVQTPDTLDYDLNNARTNITFTADMAAVDVTIGCNQPPVSSSGVLINLAEQVPTFFSRFDRTLEIVKSTEPCRRMSRERYRFYQQRGYILKHHNLANSKS